MQLGKLTAFKGCWMMLE